MRYLDAGTVKKISKIGLGTWQFGAEEWGYGKPYAEQEAYAIVRRALKLGVTLFDTAEIYGAGRSERILGCALGEDRESVFLATKLFPIVPGVPVIRQRAVASAKRLGVPRLYHGTGQSLNLVRAASPLFRPENLERTGDLIAVLREVAEAHSATPAQIALAWAIHSPAVVAIPGASSVAQLESNVDAAEIELADDEYQALNTASASFRPAAARDASPDRFLPMLKQSPRRAWYVTKTVWHDFRFKRAGQALRPHAGDGP